MNNLVKSLTNETSSPSNSGEFALPQELIPITITDNENIVGMIFGGVKRTIAGFKKVLKNKKQLFPVLILAIIWTVLTFLPAIGINPLPVKLLSYLTFARGGINGNILNKIGGFAVKGLFASLLSSFFSDKNTISNIKSGFSVLKNNIKGKKSVSPVWLFGVGFALFIYNLMVVNTTWQNAMAGIVCFAISLRALASGNSFVFKLFNLLISKIKIVKSTEVTRLMTGWTSGFGLGVLVSLIPISNGGYLFGCLAIIVAVIMFIVEKPKQGGKEHE
ncbi:MAG: hypothetical protein EOM05_04775 [Clostridia bacterium]|nr:hypothetical protein [Clostridia bacterium]